MKKRIWCRRLEATAAVTVNKNTTFFCCWCHQNKLILIGDRMFHQNIVPYWICNAMCVCVCLSASKWRVWSLLVFASQLNDEFVFGFRRRSPVPLAITTVMCVCVCENSYWIRYATNHYLINAFRLASISLRIWTRAAFEHTFSTFGIVNGPRSVVRAEI